MKRILLLSLVTLTALIMAACGGKKDVASTPADLIVGTWVSAEDLAVEEGGVLTAINDMVVTYKSSKSVNTSMSMSMSGAALPAEMTMDVTTQSTWELSEDGKTLTETITDAKVKVIGNDALAAIGDVISQGMTSQPPQSSTIISLTKDELVLLNETVGQEIRFKRK